MSETPINENHNSNDNQQDLTGAETVTLEADYKPEKPGLFELIYGTLFNPVETFIRISHTPPLLYGFVIFISVVILNTLAGILIPQDISDIPPQFAGLWSQAGPSLIIIGAIISVIFWFIQAGILQVIAELLGGQGSALGVLTVLALASIPKVVAIPFQVAAFFLSDLFVGKFLSVAVSIFVFIWWSVLLVLGLKHIQQYSTGKAVITAVAPFMTVILVFVIMFLSLFALISPFINMTQ